MHSTRRRSRAIREGFNNVSAVLSNLVSRFRSHFTRKNKNHLVVPVNDSPRQSSSLRQKSRHSSSTYIIPSSQVISNTENNNKFKKTDKSLFKVSPTEFTALGIKSTFKKSGAKTPFKKGCAK